MKKFIHLFIFICLIFISFSIVPIWDFKKSTIDLLPNDNSSHEIAMKTVKSHFNLNCNYKRNITKISGLTSYKNNVRCELTTGNNYNTVVNYNVDFEEMESAYTDTNGIYYICPKGRNHVLCDNKKGHLNPLIPEKFDDKDDWELNCYMQFQKGESLENNWKKIFVFYLNKEDYIYQIDANKATINRVSKKKYKIISFRWTTEGIGDNFPMYAIIENDNKVDITTLTFKDLSGSTKIEEGNCNNLFTIPKSNFKGFLSDDLKNSKFYYISYDPGSIDIRSGYSNNLYEISNNEPFTITHNKESPLKFIDNVTLENLKFIPYTKYAYYKLYNKDKEKYYYGIIDIEENKVIYNTDEQLINYTTYSKSSMLAITSKSAYRICAIYYDNNCVDTCNYTIYYDVENYNTCQKSYKCNSNLLIPNNICVNSCDTNIFFEDSQNQCGLCKDFSKSKPLKMVNYTGCLSENITNSFYINEEFILISCKENYSFLDGECKLVNCYETCRTCTEKSNNITEQKCLSCKSSYPLLYQGNCLKDCPNKTYKDKNDTICIACNSTCEKCDKNGCTSCSTGYYLNNNTHLCVQCHEKCEQCTSGGTDENNNCRKCKNKNDIFDKGNCISNCPERHYKTNRNTCESCNETCASCLDENSCEDCLDNYFFKNNRCYPCNENCYNCKEEGNETNHNCLSCKNNSLYLVIGGIYKNNCVEFCPENTVKDDNNKTCTYFVPIGKINENTNKSASNSKLIVWIFVGVAGFLFILVNIFFFSQNCCYGGKDQDVIDKIQTELSDMNLIVK